MENFGLKRELVPVIIKPKKKEVEEPLKPIEDISESDKISIPYRWKTK